MLPTAQVLSSRIKQIVVNNPHSPADNEADAEKAVDYFCNQLATEILKMLTTEAEVLHLPGKIQTVVSTPAGAGTGTNVVPLTGKLQ